MPNTFPRYQLPIWPRVVRIKFSESFKSQAALDRVRGSSLREHQTINQINLFGNHVRKTLDLGTNRSIPMIKEIEIAIDMSLGTN